MYRVGLPVPTPSMTRLAILFSLVSSAVYGQAVQVAPGLILGPERRAAQQRISADPTGEQLAGLVPQGNELLAVWIRRGYYAGATYISSELRSVLLDATGRPRPETSRLLAEERRIDRAFADRTNEGPLVVWTAGQKTYGQRLGGTPHLIAEGRAARALQCNASRCVVTWDFTLNVTFTIIDGDANVIRDSVNAPSQLNIVASDPDGFLFAGFRGEEVVVARLDNDGRQLFEATADRPFSRPFEIAADFDGARYVVAWTSVAAIWASRLSISGAMSSPVRAFDNPYSLRAIAWNGTQHMALLSLTIPCLGFEGTICPTTLYTLPIASTLSAAAQQMQPLATQGQWTLPAALIANGGNFYAGMQYRAGPPGESLLVSMIGADGSPSSREPISLAPQSQAGALIAAAGDHRVVFWIESDAANGKFLLLSARDDVLNFGDAHILAASANIGNLRVATVGSDILGIWPEGEPWRYRALILHSDGSTSPADAPSYDGFVASLAGSDNAWLFATTFKHATMISRAGVNLSPQPIHISDIDSQSVAAASDGQHFLIASSGTSGTYMTMVNADGSIAFMDRRVATSNTSRLSLSWNGSEYLLGTEETLQRIDANGNLRGDVLLLTQSSFLTFVPLRSGWLVSYWSGGRSYGFRIKDGQQIEAPFPMEAPVGSVLNPNGTATAIFARVLAAPPFGSAPAAILREIGWSDNARRRAIGSR